MTDTKTHPKQKVVIAGGGFGGVRAAIEMGRLDFLDVTLISDSDMFTYYPTLYLTATGGSDAQSSILLAHIFADDPVRVIIGKAVSVDRAAKTLRLKDGTNVPYDKLVMSLGVVTNYFGIPGLQENSYGIKSIEEAERLKRHLHAQLIAEHEPDLNYVIVGGGPTGIELAGELATYVRDIMKKHQVHHRAVHIDLVEMMPHLMPRLPRPVGRTIERRLRKLGVKLYLNSKVEGASGDALTVSGKPIRSHTIVWTAGVANNPFFSENGFNLSNRKKVVVDEFLRADGSKDIFVIGDNAETPYSGMAQTALHDAEFIAQNFRFEHENRPKLAYRSKEPVYVTPVGRRWASVLWGDLHLHGRAGWLLRNAADVKAFSEVLSAKDAVVQWSTGEERQELCPICGTVS